MQDAKPSVTTFVKQWFSAHRDDVIAWRRHIHAHPELSNEEFETTTFLANKLHEHGLHPVIFPATGLYVDIGDDVGDGRLAFRADIDALPVTEVSGLEFTSVNQDVTHACGHDVHTTIALATACALAEYDASHGLGVGIRVLFQPAEEIWGGGATDVIEWGGIDDVASMFAVHVEPRLRVGKIGVREGAITSATDIVELEISGPGGHTSRPHLTADLVYGLGKAITELPVLLSRRVDPRTGTVLVFGTVNSGFAPNAIPETGTLSGTLRTADIDVWRGMEELFAQMVDSVLQPVGVDYQLTYNRGVPPVVNDPGATQLLIKAIDAIDPQAAVEAPQSSGGEDFSWYLEKIPGSMARLGCWSGEGDMFDLHQGDLVVDERALDVGVLLFAAVTDEFIASGGDRCS